MKHTALAVIDCVFVLVFRRLRLIIDLGTGLSYLGGLWFSGFYFLSGSLWSVMPMFHWPAQLMCSHRMCTGVGGWETRLSLGKGRVDHEIVVIPWGRSQRPKGKHYMFCATE